MLLPSTGTDHTIYSDRVVVVRGSAKRQRQDTEKKGVKTANATSVWRRHQPPAVM